MSALEDQVWNVRTQQGKDPGSPVHQDELQRSPMTRVPGCTLRVRQLKSISLRYRMLSEDSRRHRQVAVRRGSAPPG